MNDSKIVNDFSIDLPSSVSRNDFSVDLPASVSRIYYLNHYGGTIVSISLDGKDEKVIVSQTGPEPNCLSIDSAAGHLFWSTYLGDPRIRRSGLAGDNIDILNDQLSFGGPRGIALDPTRKIFFYLDHIHLMRIPYDLSKVEDVVSSDVMESMAVAADYLHEKIYWTHASNAENIGRIMTSTYSGTNIKVILTGLTWPRAITIDAQQGWICWSDRIGLTIDRVRTDGTERQQLNMTQSDPTGLALDLKAKKLYWCELSGLIRRSDLDGTEVETIIEDKNLHLAGIALGTK